MNRILAALAVACALAVSACVPKDGAGSGTSAAGWHQIAVGAGQVIGQTKYDAKVAKVSDKIAPYCGAMQLVAAGATIWSPEKHRAIAQQAAAAVTSACNDPPSDVATALTAVVKAYEAVLAAGRAADVTVPPAGA